MAKGLISAKKASASEERRLYIEADGGGDNPWGAKDVDFF